MTNPRRWFGFVNPNRAGEMTHFPEPDILFIRSSLLNVSYNGI
ncbi:hypothetical protein QUF80_12835 [Desulfococcaceae bacterium HSG8]|nr:hypothetical protein [Desulfococcaceae bacterium HSG8]